MIQNGLYQHFKGAFYRVVGSARHTETNEVLVIYHDLGDSTKLYARPLTMFTEMVEHNGVKVPRFEFKY